jgi:hypothetical protein
MTRATATSVFAAGAVALALMIAYVLRGVTREDVGRSLPSSASESASSAAWPPRPGSAPVTPEGALDAASSALVAPPPAVADASDEASLMTRLRSLRKIDPEATIELARQGDERFPETGDAAERASILIHALASLGRASEARGEAEAVVNRYPDSSWVREIEGFTGAHRHRSVHLASDGAIEIN